MVRLTSPAFFKIMKREVIEFKKLERVVNDVLRVLSQKYGIDEDTLGWIIAEYSGLMSIYVEKRIIVSKN